ncbi:hypothetical protein GCM10027020_03550 [Nocardioides salsibiostraticola]
MDAQSLSLDHFVFYEVDRERIEVKVELQCQFDDEPEPTGVMSRRRFGDRVKKNGESIFNDTHALTWYDLFDPVPDPDRTVIYDDQFGKEHKIQIGRLVALLVPTKCQGRKAPKELDHYKVFEVINPEAPQDQPIEVKGEFQNLNTTVRAQRYFAAPAAKSHEGRDFPIMNAEAHLTFYLVDPTPKEPDYVKMKDQFGRFRVALHTAHLFAVPCLKRHWEKS